MVVVVGVKGAFVGVALSVSHEPRERRRRPGASASARVGRAGGTGSKQRLAWRDVVLVTRRGASRDTPARPQCERQGRVQTIGGLIIVVW